MTRRPPDFPTSLQGGEQQDQPDHRVGETHRRSPEAANVDPATAERDLERDRGDDKSSSDVEPA